MPIVSNAQTSDNILEAKVLKIIQEREYISEDGSKIIQQDIQMEGLDGVWKDKKIIFYGISDLEVVNTNIYKKGDNVLVSYVQDGEGNDVFYILDYIRRSNLYLLAFIFALIIVFIGKWKGLKSLLSLCISFLIIIKFIVPQILAGHNPLLIAIIGSFLILLIIIYLTEGWNAKSHLSVLSILISLVITGELATLFTFMARLTGTAGEDIMYLIGIGKNAIDFKGLLLAGILIGTLGVLDDMVLSQIEAVRQIKDANPLLDKKEIIKKAYGIGRSHLGAIINTLFLAYAAVSLPFLILFSAKSTMTAMQVINNEMIATEIIRTLVGSIGIALALPISTIIATYYYAKTKKK